MRAAARFALFLAVVSVFPAIAIASPEAVFHLTLREPGDGYLSTCKEVPDSLTLHQAYTQSRHGNIHVSFIFAIPAHGAVATVETKLLAMDRREGAMRRFEVRSAEVGVLGGCFGSREFVGQEIVFNGSVKPAGMEKGEIRLAGATYDYWADHGTEPDGEEDLP